MNRNFLVALLVSALVLFAPKAEAVTIGGVEYERLLSGNVNGKVGQWYAMRKGYSFGVYSDAERWTQVNITSTAFQADSLDNADAASRFSFEFMKDTTAASGALQSTDLKLFDAAGNALLVLQLSSGAIASTPILGAAGDFTLTGLFSVVGGDWFTEGIVTGGIYASINYANGVISNSKDFHASGGSFTLYSRAGETEIPEPASALLLLSGGVGAVWKRRARASNLN